ncbi:MAG TPA: hypothetical protein VLT36_13965, partial [Candidatus Dormibacteraeota bacterium]|nr:hypothetical protein [Candidatus Dormibacteraeota bacterium]
MKSRLSWVSIAVVAVALYFSSISFSSAQIYAKDDASSYTNPVGNAAWLSLGTSNAGFGFTAWTYTKSGADFQGFYVGNGSQGSLTSTNNKYWGMYANGPGGGNAAVAYRGFTNSLLPNRVFKIKYKPLGIGFDAANQGGFSLRHGNANASTADYDTGTRFDFFYMGGGADAYLFSDGTGGFNNTGLGFSSAPFQIEVTLLDADTYRLVIKDGSGVNTLQTYDSRPLAGNAGDSIDSFALYALQTGGDQLFNSVEIDSTSLVPPDIANVTPANNSIYVDPSTTQLSFDVLSAFSTVGSNSVKLTLNGVNQTGLTFTGFSTNWHVTLTNTLATNVLYTAVMTAQDGNGNKATNTVTFNTWASDLPFIEAEDYNFNAGGFVPTAFPDSFNGYAGLLGQNGIDYLEYDTFGVT